MDNYFDDIRKTIKEEKAQKNTRIIIKKDIFQYRLWTKVLEAHYEWMEKMDGGKYEYFAWIYEDYDGKFILGKFATARNKGATPLNIDELTLGREFPLYAESLPIGNIHHHPDETIEHHVLSGADRGAFRRLHYDGLGLEVVALGVMDGIVLFAIEGGETREVTAFYR